MSVSLLPLSWCRDGWLLACCCKVFVRTSKGTRQQGALQTGSGPPSRDDVVHCTRLSPSWTIGRIGWILPLVHEKRCFSSWDMSPCLQTTSVNRPEAYTGPCPLLGAPSAMSKTARWAKKGSHSLASDPTSHYQDSYPRVSSVQHSDPNRHLLSSGW